MGAILIGSFSCDGFLTRELIKISGKINGIQENITHIVKHLQGIDKRFEITDLAIQRLGPYVGIQYFNG